MADKQIKDFTAIVSAQPSDGLHISDTSDSGNDKFITLTNIGLVKVYVQDGSPGTSDILPNSLWIDTNDNNKLYAFNSGTSSWVERNFSGAGTIALTELESIAQYEVLGRDAAGSGSVEALSRSEIQAVVNNGQWIGIANINNIADQRILGNVSGGAAAPSELADSDVRSMVLDNNVITNAMLADMAANTIKSNATNSSADPSDLAIAANKFPARASTGNIEAKDITDFALTILDDANASAVRTTLGLGSAAVENIGTTSGDVPQLTTIDSNVGFAALDGTQLKTNVRTITTTPVTLDATYRNVLVDDDTIGGAATVNLPAASGNAGITYNIKKLGTSGNVTVDGDGSETIDGATTTVLSTQYDSVSIVCDGSNWFII